MPVTHQWKSKSKTEDQTAAAAASPTLQAAAGKKETQADESSGKKGSAPSSSSSWKKKDEKQPIHPDDDDAEESGGDEDEEEDPNQPGRIRNLAGFFATQRDEPKEVRKKRFAVDDDPETIVLENEPERLEGVIRADDPGEWQKPIELEKGWAKNLANRFLSQQQEDTAAASKKPFVMDIEEGAQTIVLENEPVVLEGVVRSVDKTEDVIGKRGRIKNIAGRFANPQADDAADRGGSSCWREPVDFDAARTRGNVADKWKNQRYDEPSSPTAGDGGGGGKPKWMLELESAKEYGVFENEPEVRSDVVRADDEQPDVISAQHTRNLRKMWSQIEREEVKDAAPSKRPDILIRPKKKEPSPEPEPPPPPPVEETKPGRRFGAAGRIGGGAAAFGAVYGGRQAKKEKTPPPPEPEPPKQQQPTRRGFRQVGAPAQSQPPAQPAPVPEPAPTTPDPKNPFKTALKPVPRRR